MMAMDRREFLKIAGLAAMVGVGARAGFEWFAPGSVGAALQEAPAMAGRKMGMAVDLQLLDEAVAEACIRACHSYNNVPNLGNPKEEIKWIWKETYAHTFPGQESDYLADAFQGRGILVLCNHCTNPPCCRVCPTKATWKREDGIVMMDMHRCIGCRYCMAACPYGARSFNWSDPRKAPKALNPDFPSNRELPTRSKGVVEKCTFCVERLAKGLVPACVEAAEKRKPGVLIFGDLEDTNSPLRAALRSRYAIRRKTELGTGPNIFYMV